LHVDEQHTLHTGALALAIRHRGELDGFVLLGEKPNGDEYRPDEVAVLGHVAHEIGLDLHALRNELLRAELAAHAKRAELDAVKILEQGRAIDALQMAFTRLGSTAV